MKAIIENGAANKDIQNCFVTEHCIEIIFDSAVDVSLPAKYVVKCK